MIEAADRAPGRAIAIGYMPREGLDGESAKVGEGVSESGIRDEGWGR